MEGTLTNRKFNSGLELRFILMVFAVVGLFLATSFFIQARSIIIHNETSDFSAYFAAYTIKSELGAGIYEKELFLSLEASNSVDSNVRRYLYSPLFADVLSLFMPKDYTNARLAWLMIEHAAIFLLFVITAFILMRVFAAERVPALIVSALVLVSFSAVERSFHYGQASAVVALFVYLALFLHCIGRTYTATFFAAFGSVLKIYPIVYLIALIIKGKLKESLMMVFFMILIIFFSIVLFGSSDWLQFVTFQTGNDLVSKGSAGASALSYEIPNYSPSALVFLLSDQFGWGWTASSIWKVIVVVVLLAGITIYALFWRRIYESFGFLQTVGLGLIGVMLTSPLLWNHVFIMLIPIYGALLYRATTDSTQSFASFFWILISFSLVAFPDFLTNAKFTNDGLLVLLKYTKLYGLFIIAYFLCFSDYAKVWSQNKTNTPLKQSLEPK